MSNINLHTYAWQITKVKYLIHEQTSILPQKLMLISFCFIHKHQKNRFIRHIICLPINCQRTHSNAKTVRKKKSEYLNILLRKLHTKVVHVGAFLSQKKKQPSQKKTPLNKQRQRVSGGKTVVRTLKKSVWR